MDENRAKKAIEALEGHVQVNLFSELFTDCSSTFIEALEEHVFEVGQGHMKKINNKRCFLKYGS